MSTSEIFGRLANTYLKPPKPRPTFNPVRHPKARLRDLKPVLRPGQLDRAPSVFPWIQPKIVQKETEVEKHKRKTRLQPHMRKWRCHVTLLAGKQGMEQELMPFAWMKMRVKDIKMVEQAGGLEAKMLSTASSKLSIHGKQLRNALFNQLYRLREEKALTKDLVLHDSSPGGSGQSTSSIEMLSIEEVKSMIASGTKLSEYYGSAAREESLRIAQGKKGASGDSKPLAITDGKSESSTKTKPVQGRDVQGKQTQAV